MGALTADDFARWRRLEDRAAEPYTYLSADYLSSADPHWPAALPVRLLLVEGDGELRVVMPFSVGILHSRIPLRVLTTADGVLSDEGVRNYPLVDREYGEEALRVLFASLRSFGLPRLIDVAGLPSDGELRKLVAAALTGSHRVLERGRSLLAYARFPGSAGRTPNSDVDVVPHHRGSSTRRQANQRRRALERDLGSELTLADRSDEPDVIGDFLDLQSVGWKGDSSKHGLAYRLTGREQWFREIATKFQAEGRFAAFELSAGGRPVYIAVGLTSGTTLFGLQDAYDETGASQGLGNLGRTAHLNWLASGPFEAFDPNMFWSYVDAMRLFPDTREQVRLLVAAHGPWSWMLVRTVEAALRVRVRVRTVSAQARSHMSRARTPVEQ